MNEKNDEQTIYELEKRIRKLELDLILSGNWHRHYKNLCDSYYKMVDAMNKNMEEAQQ